MWRSLRKWADILIVAAITSSRSCRVGARGLTPPPANRTVLGPRPGAMVAGCQYETPALAGASRGVSDRIRTGDRLDHNQELYQLSYAHRASLNVPRAAPADLPTHLG